MLAQSGVIFVSFNIYPFIPFPPATRLVIL